MTRILVILAALTASLWLGWTMLGASPARGAPATFHIDFDRGNDGNDGRSLASAWKHAPGDPAATGQAADARLAPGDSVVFAPGVRYRGTIKPEAKGTSAAPITFRSASPDDRGIIDGSDPVARVRPCASAAECGGAAAWSELVLIDFGAPLPPSAALFSDAGPLYRAQGPNPSDPFYSEEISEFIEADGDRLARGVAELPADLAALIAAPGERDILLWVRPNKIEHRPITAIEGTIARFDPGGLKFYTDRPAWIAVAGHPALVDRPGEFAMLPGGRSAVAMLPEDAGALSVATGRGGIDLAGSEHVVIRDLAFENMAASGPKLASGVAIVLLNGEASDIRIENNRFRNFVMPSGQGPILLKRASDVVVANNLIDTVVIGSGMRIMTGSRIRIEGNEIKRIGRTGIMLMAIDDALVTRNRITDAKGVHGNGMSAYLGNRDIRFIANTVTDARQPATFHGNGDKTPRAENIVFANNLFVATDGALGALISWGKNTHGVEIRNNVLLGGDAGLRLSSGDPGVTISDNVVAGMIVGGGMPEDWRLEGNEFLSLTWQQDRNPNATVSSLPLGASIDALATSVPTPAVCSVIGRSSIAPSETARLAAGSIGAEIQCR